MATNHLPNTAMLSIRLDAAALAAFDRVAVGRGGRSAMVRQMIERTLQESDHRPLIDRPEGASRNRVSLRFTDVEIAVIEVRAAQGTATPTPSRAVRSASPSTTGAPAGVDDTPSVTVGFGRPHGAIAI